jgi:magnesium chelatase family protein
MLINLFAASLVGIDALRVEIETNVSNGLPAFTFVGLSDNAVKKCRENFLTAIPTWTSNSLQR